MNDSVYIDYNRILAFVKKQLTGVVFLFDTRRRRRAQAELDGKCNSDTCPGDLQLVKPCASAEGLEERVPMLSKPVHMRDNGANMTVGEYTDIHIRNVSHGRQNIPAQEISLLEQLNQDLLEDQQRLGQCDCMSTYARTCSTFKPRDPIYDNNPGRPKRCQIVSKGVPFYYELDAKNLHHHGGPLPGPDVVTVTMCHLKDNHSESEGENDVNRLKEQTL